MRGFFPGWLAMALASLSAGTTFGDSFLNFESGHVRPLALSPSKNLLFAVNTPDNRLEVFQVTEDGLESSGEVVVGLEPVAVVARSETEVYVVNHLSDSVSCVDVTDPARPFVKATLLVGDEPRDVIVAGPGDGKIFVTTAHRGQSTPQDPQLLTPGIGRADVWVFNATDLSESPAVVTLFCDTPRALARNSDGTRVYAAAFHSGNQSTCLNSAVVDPDFDEFFGDSFNALGMPEPTSNVDGVAAPETGLIVKLDGDKWLDSAGRDWSPRMRFDLPDKDVFVIDATQNPPVEIDAIAHAGTVLFNMAVHPITGKVYVSNIDAQNDVRFEPEINGHVAESRITIIDDSVDGGDVAAIHLNPHVDYSAPSGPPEEIAASLAFPLDMEFSADGETLYVTAFGSGTVGVLNAAAAVVDRIAVGGGPSGLALDEGRKRLYVMNRFDHTVSTVDTESRSLSQTVSLTYNPEPLIVQEGRPFLYDARNSGHGDSACASCHIFADFDSLAWDLGDPGGAQEPNPVRNIAFVSPGLRPLHPMKGPMTTQSLRGMLDAGPMHWRGDRNAVSSGAGIDVFDEELAFMAFRPAFQGLLGMGTEFPAADMEKFTDFILTVVYPPNPIAAIDDTQTADEAAGEQVFDSSGDRSGVGGDGVECGRCHVLPFGTDGRGTFEGETQDFKVAHLRNLYQKVGMFGYALPNIINSQPFTVETVPTPHLGDQVRGVAYLHDGSIPTLENFFRVTLAGTVPFEFRDEPGRSGDQKVSELSAFLLAFDTGLAPVVGQQFTVDAETVDTGRLVVMRGRADAGRCELVAHGIVVGERRGYFYQGAGIYQSDRLGETVAEGDLLGALQTNDVLTFTAVYAGGGTRIGVDRDEDGWLDGDEVARGTDPADATSFPNLGAPENLSAEVMSGRVALSWLAAPMAPTPDSYNVYRSLVQGEPGEKINDTPVPEATYLDTGLAADTYHYSVTAIAGAGESEVSSQLEVLVSESALFFLRGNCNGDLQVDISDAVFSLIFLFTSGDAPTCEESCNTNGDSAYDVSDPVFVLNFLFSQGSPPGLWPACEEGLENCAADACPE